MEINLNYAYAIPVALLIVAIVAAKLRTRTVETKADYAAMRESARKQLATLYSESDYPAEEPAWARADHWKR